MKQSERDFAAPYPGSYLLTVSLAQQAYRLSAFCRSLMKSEMRAAFKANEDQCMRDAGLSGAEIAMVRARDWLGMLRYGVNHFLVFRVAGLCGDRLESDPESLASLSHQQLIERGGTEGVEVILWLCMRGALSPRVRRVHRNYYHATLTGYGQVLFEDMENPPARV